MWHQIHVEVQASDAEAISAQLEAWGALSVSLQDAGDQPLFEPPLNTTPLWQLTRITGLFAGDSDLEALQHHMRAAAWPSWRIDTLEERDWTRVWMADFHPMRFGRRLWVCPTGHQVEEPHAMVVTLDPGLAFGTGTHPTTALCLAWLDEHSTDLGTVLDYGCGSGILAIAALKLGAPHALGVDIDPQALIASHDNAVKNDVQDRLAVYLTQHAPHTQANTVLANILANPLIALAPTLARLTALGGNLILSGILASQAEEVSRAYEDDFLILETVTQDGWVRIWGRKTNKA